MANNKNKRVTERLSEKQKEAHDHKWYKEKAKEIITRARTYRTNIYRNNGNIDEKTRIKTNYDLFNNIINLSDFEYVCKPFGDIDGMDSSELPAMMVNRDISSYRIKALLGMEMGRSFGYKVIAENPEATTRKEKKTYDKIQKSVIDMIMAPIRKQAQIEVMEELEDRELSEEEKKEVKKKIDQEIEKNTPERVHRYMKREYQAPSEVQGQQLLSYFKKALKLRHMFNRGWKSSLLSSYEVYTIEREKYRPKPKVVNPMYFTPVLKQDDIFIEEGEGCLYEERMPASKIVTKYDLTKTEVDRVYEMEQTGAGVPVYNTNEEDDWGFDHTNDDENYDRYPLVQHVNFKGIRKIGWLDYQNQMTGKIVKRYLVDENYEFDEDSGDLNIDWEWVEQTYEVTIIGGEIYKNMGPIKGQMKDESSVYESKLQYYGAVYDNDNSVPTSVMDRMKYYQYLYNIIMYRIEILISSDEGKKIMMNINAIPDNEDPEKWRYFFKTSPISYFNPNQKGMSHEDASTIAKELDLSLVSDIGKYIDILSFLEKRCGETVGITEPVLGQTQTSEKVANNQQNLVQTGNMLEPYFDLHNLVKKNVMQALLDTAREMYTEDGAPEYLSYVLDDMSTEAFNIDKDLLDLDKLGIFLEDTAEADKAKRAVEELAHAAMQNDKMELSGVMTVMKTDSPTEAEEQLKVSEDNKRKQAIEDQERDNAAKERLEKIIEENKEKAHEREKELVKLKEEEERKTKITEKLIISSGFNENKDMDDDGIPDILEYARKNIDAKIDMKEQRRKDKELDHQIKKDNRELDIKEKDSNKQTSK